jgi:chemotaxis protein MotA
VGLTTIIGIGLAIGSLVFSFMLEGGKLSDLFSLTALLLIFGGTIGATMVSFSFTELMAVPALIKKIIAGSHQDEIGVIEEIVRMAETVRREGLLYLENKLPQLYDPFMRKGIQLIVDGTDPQMVRNILETELYAIEERHHSGFQIFETAGGYAPTMGIIGTVMGLVKVLGSLANPETLGPAIAMAFIATLYGVGSANIFWLPVAEKLKNISKKETMLRELEIEGILSLQAGSNPMLIRERLTAFLNPAHKKKFEGEGGD